MATIETQNNEFNAVSLLSKRYEQLVMTPVVDDDYPRVRHEYEGAVRVVIEAFKVNGRKI